MPWAESGMVMKETWASVRALEAFLGEANISVLTPDKITRREEDVKVTYSQVRT